MNFENASYPLCKIVYQNRRQLLFDTYGFVNRRLLKEVGGRIFSFNFLYFGLFIKPLRINNDLKVEAALNLLKNDIPFIYPTSCFYFDLNKLRNIYNDKKILNLLVSITNEKTESQLKGIFDILTLLEIEFDLEKKILYRARVENMMDRKCKSISEVFQNLTYLMYKATSINFDLGQSRFKFLEKESFNRYSLYIPQKQDELIDLGSILSNCLGSGQYGNKVRDGEIILTVVLKDSKPMGVIEFCLKSKKILQAKAHDNQEMDLNLIGWFNSLAMKYNL